MIPGRCIFVRLATFSAWSLSGCRCGNPGSAFRAGSVDLRQTPPDWTANIARRFICRIYGESTAVGCTTGQPKLLQEAARLSACQRVSKTQPRVLAQKEPFTPFTPRTV